MLGTRPAVSCNACAARVRRWGAEADVTGEPARQEGPQVVATVGLDDAIVATTLPSLQNGVRSGYCECERRWEYARVSSQARMGELRVALQPDPQGALAARVASPPSAFSAAEVARFHAKRKPPPPPPPEPPRAIPPQPPPTRVRDRVARRFPMLVGNYHPYFGVTYATYFATFRDEARPLSSALRFTRGTFILALRAEKTCPRREVHPLPLDRPELAAMFAHRVDHAPAERSGEVHLLEIPVEYFEPGFVEQPPCCLGVEVISVAEGRLYRRTGPDSFYSEVSGGHPDPMPLAAKPPSRTAITLRGTVHDAFPDVLDDTPSPEARRGVFEGSMREALASLGATDDEVVLAVEWATHGWEPSHCPHGTHHSSWLERAVVGNWIAPSSATTGFVTREGEPLLIAIPAPSLVFGSDDDRCCLGVGVMVRSRGLLLRALPAGRVAWEQR